MSILTIFLVIIVLLLLFLVISYYLNISANIGILDLKTTVPAITSDSISKKSAANYYYATWVYVNTWDTSLKTLFTYGGHSLVLGTTMQDLMFKYKVNNVEKSTTLTNKFPIQKWVHVAISKNGNILDFYLDGKLVKSYQPDGSIDVAGTTSSIVFGSTGNKNDIFLAKFQRNTNTLDPKSAFNLYLMGPGTGVPMTSDYNYNLSMSVLKDSVVQKTYKLY